MLKTYIAAMSRLHTLKDRLRSDESGAALIEYSILIGLISAAAVATISTVGTWVSSHWTTLSTNLTAA